MSSRVYQAKEKAAILTAALVLPGGLVLAALYLGVKGSIWLLKGAK